MTPIEQPSSGQEFSPLTARSVCLGFFLTILVNLMIPYNDRYLLNTMLIGNHFPVISIVILAILVFVVNAGVKFFFKVDGLNSGELLLIWSMIGVGGATDIALADVLLGIVRSTLEAQFIGFSVPVTIADATATGADGRSA